jgi:hypothetical protein
LALAIFSRQLDAMAGEKPPTQAPEAEPEIPPEAEPEISPEAAGN